MSNCPRDQNHQARLSQSQSSAIQDNHQLFLEQCNNDKATAKKSLLAFDGAGACPPQTPTTAASPVMMLPKITSISGASGAVERIIEPRFYQDPKDIDVPPVVVVSVQKEETNIVNIRTTNGNLTVNYLAKINKGLVP